ncbi:MAG: hypothetical protein AAC990_04790 [Dehalococcoides mccartyi]|uniref:hypothetical protein n=1 Tax=Dehalococcoides mccartyi TaxID=61435 RepID=UPI0030F77A38
MAKKLPRLMLGKRPAKQDRRTLKLETVIKNLPAIPDCFDFDANSQFKIPLPMFANNAWGDCVIAGRAHQTLRFETIDQQSLISISDQDVLQEYWHEQGGGRCWNKRPDNGLVVLDSLKAWRSGWKAGGHNYSIYAYGKINPYNHDMAKAAIYLLSGAGAGLLLPLAAQNQEVWEATEGDSGRIGSWGGHYVYIVGYTAIGPVCITWGQRKQMTWAFLDKYCDELWGIVDDKNYWPLSSYIDIVRLNDYLNSVSQGVCHD